MSDHDPYGEPTRADVPVTDATTAMPATVGGPPLPPDPPPPDRPDEDRPDRRGWILAGLLLLVLLVGLAALLLGGDDDEEPSATTTTTTPTTTSESTSTTEATTTTAEPSTTTTTAPTTTSTANAASCAPSTDPTDAEPTAERLYAAYADGDRACAEDLGTDDAVETLFAIPGEGGGWRFQGCTEVGDGEPAMDCAYSFDGGATHFVAVFSETEGWQVSDVYQTVD